MINLKDELLLAVQTEKIILSRLTLNSGYIHFPWGKVMQMERLNNFILERSLYE